MFQTKDNRQIFGFVGVGFLVIGSFAPLIYVPFFGSINYVAYGRGDGIILLIITGFSAYFIATEKYAWLRISAALSAMLCFFS